MTTSAASIRKYAQLQRGLTWSGVGMAVLFFAGMAIAHFIPPPSPSRTAIEVARDYQEHQLRIRIGIFIMMAGSTLLAPFSAAIAVQIRRIEDRPSPLAYIQVMCGACLVIVFLLPSIVWQIAAYRPFRSPEITQTLTDMAWIPYVGLVTEFTLQAAVIAIAIFRDEREQPLFPRWVAYVNIFAALGVIPGGMNVFFDTGPIAWNGLFAWWGLVGTFFVWMVVTIPTLLHAISRQEQEDTALLESTVPEADPHFRIDNLQTQIHALQQALADLEAGAFPEHQSSP